MEVVDGILFVDSVGECQRCRDVTVTGPVPLGDREGSRADRCGRRTDHTVTGRDVRVGLKTGEKSQVR